MSATNQFENDLLSLIFENIAAQNVGDASGLQPSGGAGSFFASLHTDTLEDADTDQTQDESAYTSYARVAVARSSAKWTVAAGNCSNDDAITFPEATGGSESVTDFGIGFAASAAGYLQIFGVLGAALAISNGIQAQFVAGQLDISLD